MSSPYQYVPADVYYPTPYVDGYPSQQQQRFSPFIPPPDLYPPSPYSPPSPLPELSPFTTPTYIRERRPSFHATTAAAYAPASPYIPPAPYGPGSPYDGYDDLPRLVPATGPPGSGPNSPFVQPASPYGTPSPHYSPLPLAHPGLPPAPTVNFHRRRSFSDYFRHPFQSASTGFLPGSGLVSGHVSPQTTQIHPLLNGETGTPSLSLNLADPRFEPYRILPTPSREAVILTHQEAAQPATYPPCYRLRIKIERTPQWPIELQYNYRQTSSSLGLFSPSSSSGVEAIPPQAPITVGDVLIMIHRSMQTPISHLDWGRLTASEQAAVTRAYARRVAGNPGEAQVGVKRVDFLLDRYMFRGMVRRRGNEGWEVFRLIV